jgi:hypothetical protein
MYGNWKEPATAYRYILIRHLLGRTGDIYEKYEILREKWRIKERSTFLPGNITLVIQTAANRVSKYGMRYKLL